MLKFNLIFAFCFILPFCKPVPLFGKLAKCNLKDNDCHVKVLESILNQLSDVGEPEYNIPKIDPYILKHFEMNVLGLLHVDLVDGSAEGIKTCKITALDVNTDTKLVTVDLTCDHLNIAGSYKLKTLPTFDALAGGVKIHGDGTGSLTIDKLHLNFVIPFELKKSSDGEIHFHINAEDAKHSVEVVNKAEFAGNNLYIGSVDISKVATSVLNENWRAIIKSFAHVLVNPILDIILQHVSSVLDVVSTKEFIADDVSQYL